MKSESLLSITRLASENSLHISKSLFIDPYWLPKRKTLRGIVGNIGRPEISFLDSPDKSRLNARELRKYWKVINHAPFEGKLENNLNKISLKLSLYGYRLLIKIKNPGCMIM